MTFKLKKFIQLVGWDADCPILLTFLSSSIGITWWNSGGRLWFRQLSSQSLQRPQRGAAHRFREPRDSARAIPAARVHRHRRQRYIYALSIFSIRRFLVIAALTACFSYFFSSPLLYSNIIMSARCDPAGSLHKEGENHFLSPSIRAFIIHVRAAG